MTKVPDHDLKSLLYRCQHRGVKELDLILGGFAQKYLCELEPSELTAFKELLEIPENDLLNWLTGVSDPPLEVQTPILKKIRAFAMQ